MRVQQRFPHVFDFLASSIQEESTEVKTIIKQRVDPIYEQGTKKIYEHIDYTKFREDIDIEKAIKILNWTMAGFGEKGLKQLATFEDLSQFGEQYLKEWERYAEILKHSFYK